MADRLSKADLRKLRKEKKGADDINAWIERCELDESALEGRSMDQILDIWNEGKDD